MNTGAVAASNTMVRKMEKQCTVTTCIALNYDIFRELYDIDLQRSEAPDTGAEINESDKPF
jgi:hypothetical protein